MRKKQLLHKKIENMIPNLFLSLNKPDFKLIKEKWVRPEFDEELGLYRWDYMNQFYSNIYPKSNIQRIYIIYIFILLDIYLFCRG